MVREPDLVEASSKPSSVVRAFSALSLLAAGAAMGLATAFFSGRGTEVGALREEGLDPRDARSSSSVSALQAASGSGIVHRTISPAQRSTSGEPASPAQDQSHQPAAGAVRVEDLLHEVRERVLQAIREQNLPQLLDVREILRGRRPADAEALGELAVLLQMLDADEEQRRSAFHESSVSAAKAAYETAPAEPVGVDVAPGDIVIPWDLVGPLGRKQILLTRDNAAPVIERRELLDLWEYTALDSVLTFLDRRFR